MSKSNSKKFIKIFIVLFMILSFDFSSFSKTIDINGISVSLNVETAKKKVGTGVNVKDNNKFSDTEYEKEEKEIEDESIDVKLSIKNKNSYENAKIVVEDSIPKGFRKIDNDNKNTHFNLSLEPNVDKEYKFTYKYHKSYLKDQNNEFLYDNDGNIIDDKNDIKYIENSKRKNSDNNNKNIKYNDKEGKNAEEIVKSANKKHGYKIIISIILFFICIGMIFAFRMLYRYIKDKDSETFGNDYNAFIFIIILSMLVSTLSINSISYAKDYVPQIQEFGKTYTKVISERVKYNDVYYVFAYKVTIEYENTYEVTDEDYEVDTDGDGLVDAFEYEYMTDKNNPDTDSDGLSDYMEVMLLDYNPLSIDTFEDGVKDIDRDYDLDGLTNKEEIEYGTNLTLVDTDYDTISDYDEINIYFTNPLSIDTDEDLLSDSDEIKLGLDPNNPKTDGITLDSERKIMQELKKDLIPETLRTGDITILKIEGEVSGNIENSLKVKNKNAPAFDEVVGFVSKGIEISLNDDEKVNIELDVSNVSERRTLLTIVKYENGMLIPVDTRCDGNIISANVGTGIYGVVDSEIILRNMNIYIKDYMD